LFSIFLTNNCCIDLLKIPMFILKQNAASYIHVIQHEPTHQCCSLLHTSISSDYITRQRPKNSEFSRGREKKFDYSPQSARLGYEGQPVFCTVGTGFLCRRQSSQDAKMTIQVQPVQREEIVKLHLYCPLRLLRIIDMDTSYARVVRTASLTSYSVRYKILHQRTASLS
jgi:hypothetical protein